MTDICGANELNSFRSRWAGGSMLSLVQLLDHILVNWSVGVGKSYNIDDTIDAAIRSGVFRLVILLVATRKIIDERRCIQQPQEGIKVVNLIPRPYEMCGSADRRWRELEKQRLGTLGRANICSRCMRKDSCSWVDQYGTGLAGAQVVVGTQAHLERDSEFILKVVHKVGVDPEEVLVIIDEADAIVRTSKRVIHRKDLEFFLDTLNWICAGGFGDLAEKWRDKVYLLSQASTSDLESNAWRMPVLTPDLIMVIQGHCYRRQHDDFRFIGYELISFGISDVASREVGEGGDIYYTVPKKLPFKTIIYSATTSMEFTNYRLGGNYQAPFADFRFWHPETKWYNIASRIGTKRFFLPNSSQIMDFFALLVIARIESGKRVLLVAKKCFVEIVADKLQRRLSEFGMDSARVITEDFSEENLSQPGAIPIIHYGVIGVNNFQEFDCAYCVTSYYVNEDAISETLQDLLDSESQIPLKIKIRGQPPRRIVLPENTAERYTDVSQIAPHALNYLEMGAVIQTVGRVRPFTKPREIITFQCGAPTNFKYTQEFDGLSGIRQFFNLPTRKDRKLLNTKEKVREAKLAGLKQTDAIRQTNLSLRTIQRYWKN